MDEPNAYRQGAHPDPLDPANSPPDPTALPKRWQEALTSAEMAAYRAGLMLPGCPNVRDAILDDLSTYYSFDPAECVGRCINWEQWSVQEWQARPRHFRDGLADFYNRLQSWSFDLLWYAYLQAEGWSYPAPVVVARMLPKPPHGVHCLDFGSGVGDTAQLLVSLGYHVDLADVSQTLLEFARFRLERREQQASYIDLNTTVLRTDQYDVIIARDVLAHVPDFLETVTRLHTALRPGGLLFANFDTRPACPENAWHLYSNDVPLRRFFKMSASSRSTASTMPSPDTSGSSHPDCPISCVAPATP